MKESHPGNTTKFSKERGNYRKQGFRWWVSYALKKQDMIIPSIKSRLNKSTHKFSIEVPTSVEHERAIDKKNGKNLCMDALEMEMYNIGVDFE